MGSRALAVQPSAAKSADNSRGSFDEHRQIAADSEAPLACPGALAFNFSDVPLLSRNERALLSPDRLPWPMQAKLEIGAVNDPLEREADQVADRVLRMSDAAPLNASAAEEGLRRKCSSCTHEDQDKNDEETHDKLSRKESAGASALDGAEAPPAVSDVLRSPGQPLDANTLSFFEPRFGASLSSVRVHTDEGAARSARAVNAMAYTVSNHIVFGHGRYAPATSPGRRLLAHELAHSLQQGLRSSTPLRGSSPRARPVTAGPLSVARAVLQIGNVQAQVDYGDLINIPATDYPTAIQSRFQAYAGAPLAAPVIAQINGFTTQQQQWLLYGLDVLADNASLAPGLNRTRAFQRLVDRAPASATHPLGTASLAFEREVLVTSGWAEEALSGGLTAPTDFSGIDPLLNPPPDASAPPGGVFDAATFNAELPGLTRTVLTGSSQNPANWPGSRPQPLADVQSVGDVVQQQARDFFAPYADTGRDNRFLAGWQYSGHISSVTTNAAGSPMPVSRDDRISLISNRATIAGRLNNGGPSLFSRTNFDSDRDAAAFDAIVTALDNDPAVQTLVTELVRHTGQHDRLTHEVGISTEVSTANSECDTRWNTIRTLCHELMHALAHPDLFAATSSSPRFPSGVPFDQVLIEGMAEVLGVELFRSVRTAAAGNPTLLTQLTQGIAGTCTPPTTTVSIGYGQAGANADSIRGIVGEDRFRAAYFHGKVALIGL